MKHKYVISILVAVLTCLLSFTAHSAPITITQISDLDFGVAFLGDSQKRVPSSNVENAENASFLITGDAGRTFTVTRPGRIWMTHTPSGDRIRVKRFRARPNNSGRIRNNGERLIFVGATRNRIPAGISTGSYSGTFTITVVY